MKRIFLLIALMAFSCADEQIKFDLQRAINAQEGRVSENLLILPKKTSEKQNSLDEGDYKPFFAPLAYYCDPNIYTPNIILTANACRPFLNRFIQQGFPYSNYFGRK